MLVSRSVLSRLHCTTRNMTERMIFHNCVIYEELMSLKLWIVSFLSVAPPTHAIVNTHRAIRSIHSPSLPTSRFDKRERKKNTMRTWSRRKRRMGNRCASNPHLNTVRVTGIHSLSSLLDRL